MFRSKRRDIVIPQSEHARIAGHIAQHWGNEKFPTPEVARGRLALGVALHDRGYRAMDTLPLGEISDRKWLETQSRGVTMRHTDPIVDLIALAHIRRLVSSRKDPAAATLVSRIDERIGDRRQECGMSEQGLLDIDTITRVSDTISFWLSFETDGGGEYSVYAGWPGGRRAIDVQVRAEGEVVITPWPLRVPAFRGYVFGYEAEGYPKEAEAVVVAYQAHAGDS